MSEAKFGVNDLVFIRPDKVDSYFMLENPRGKVVRDSYNGMVKVEIFDTASQDTEGHNCTGKFAVGDISFQPFPTVPNEKPKTTALPSMFTALQDSQERERLLTEALERIEDLAKFKVHTGVSDWNLRCEMEDIARETLAKIRGTNG